MDLFRDINKGKFGNNPKLKRDAKHELSELGGEKRAEAHEKKMKMAKKMKVPHSREEFLKYGRNKKAISYRFPKGGKGNAEITYK